jgi:hypothetical protein
MAMILLSFELVSCTLKRNGPQLVPPVWEKSRFRRTGRPAPLIWKTRVDVDQNKN